MKKIVAVIDGLKYSDNTVAYAIYLAKKANAHLVGVFLDDFTYHSYKIYELVHNEGVLEEEVERMEEKDKLTRRQSVGLFEQACAEAGIQHSVHHDKNIAIHELLHESIYADLLVIDRKETFTHYDENVPTRFIRELLVNVECPVLAVPESFHKIEKLVLLYDGEPSSVFAIKMFGSVLSELKDLPTEVVTVKSNIPDSHVPDGRLMKEFLKRHFPNASYTVLHGSPESVIISHLVKYQNELIVLGAYKRGLVSRWMRPSLADHLMQKLQVPLFIAHR